MFEAKPNFNGNDATPDYMKPSLKDYIKNWSVKQIIGSAVSDGMMFMANNPVNNFSSEELQKNKRIMVKELNSRIKKL